jgi:hypothetical protein
LIKTTIFQVERKVWLFTKMLLKFLKTNKTKVGLLSQNGKRMFNSMGGGTPVSYEDGI